MSTRRLLEIVAILFLLMGILIARQLYLSQSAPIDDNKEIITITNECDLEKNKCTANLPNGKGKIIYDISKRPIPVLENFNFLVETQNFSAEKIVVDFLGTNMDMGLIREPAIRQNGGQNLYSAGLIIPICTTDKMIWQLTIYLQSQEQGNIILTSKFTTSHESL